MTPSWARPAEFVTAFGGWFPFARDVQLVIKVSRGHANAPDLARLKAACKDAGPVVLIDQVMSEEAFALTKACDCYVSLHRSEGYGLTMAEAMFFGKPTIATNYSGNVDFMTADTSLLIALQARAPDADYSVYRKGSLSAGIQASPTRPKRCGPGSSNILAMHGLSASRATTCRRGSLKASRSRMQQRLIELQQLRNEERR